VSDEQFLTSPFLPRFHLFSHKLKFFLGGPPGPLGPGALAPATPPPLGGPDYMIFSTNITLCVVGVDVNNAVIPSTGPPTSDVVLYILHMGDGTIPTMRNN